MTTSPSALDRHRSPSSTTAITGGQAVVEAVRQAGVQRIFGVPGESFMGVLDALYDAPIEFVSTRHEGGAAFMASGYAKISGQVGVCVGTRAVGASNLAIGIHTARQDSTPMLALAGQVRRGDRAREAFQELDLVGVFSHYCKWAVEIDDAARAPELMARALWTARTGRPGPVFVSLPEDMLRDPAPRMPVGACPLPAPPGADPDVLRSMLERLVAAERPVILAGGGILNSPGAYEFLVRLAEAIEVPVVTAWRRHDVFPADHLLALGSASLGQPSVVWERLAASDVLLAIGTRFQEITTQAYRLPTRATAVLQIDIDPESIGRTVPAALSAVADAGAALRTLLALVSGTVPGMDERRAANRRDRDRYVDAVRFTVPVGLPGTVDPSVVIDVLRTLLPADGIVTTDAGNFYGWLSRYYPFRRPYTFVGPTSGAMGYALPAAIGAKLARPNAPVVCLAGDGGFMMTMQELETAVRYAAPVVAIVFDNQQYGTIRMHQERDHPGRPVGTRLTTPDLVSMAEAFGVRGIRVANNADVPDAVQAALTADQPSLLHVAMDPNQLSVGGVRQPARDCAVVASAAGD